MMRIANGLDAAGMQYMAGMLEEVGQETHLESVRGT